MSALAYVGVVYGAIDTTTTTVSSSSFSLSAGNHVVVFLRYDGGTTTATISDTAGNTFEAMPVVGPASTLRGQMFYCFDALGDASNVVTATLGAGRTFVHLHVMQFSGDTPTGVDFGFDQIAAGAGNTTFLRIPEPGITFGENSILVSAEALLGNDSTRVFADTSGGTWVNVSNPAYSRTQAAYSVRSAGESNTLTSYTGNNATSSRLFMTLALDSGVNVPGDDTVARVTQSATEVLMTNTNPGALVTQMAVEVLRPDSGPPGPSTVPPLIFTAG
jgi:hypothetical protein